MIRTENIELDLFTWDVHFASSIPGPLNSKGDRERFLSFLESSHERYGALMHVYCLMKKALPSSLETPRSDLTQTLHRAKEKWIEFKKADVRNIPVLKKLKGAPSLEQIDQTVGSMIIRTDPLQSKI
ncbi:MAG: hypothetical protein JRK53_24035 [Deltaproteobacteria bacterium]|nr:hypothetical protein [Deltaproteobacteria bacterium]